MSKKSHCNSPMCVMRLLFYPYINSTIFSDIPIANPHSLNRTSLSTRDSLSLSLGVSLSRGMYLLLVRSLRSLISNSVQLL